MIHYLTTNRRFYKLTELQFMFPDWKTQLNALYSEGKIKVREGINGKVIEVL